MRIGSISFKKIDASKEVLCLLALNSLKSICDPLTISGDLEVTKFDSYNGSIIAVCPVTWTDLGKVISLLKQSFGYYFYISFNEDEREVILKIKES